MHSMYSHYWFVIFPRHVSLSDNQIFSSFFLCRWAAGPLLAKKIFSARLGLFRPLFSGCLFAPPPPTITRWQKMSVKFSILIGGLARMCPYYVTIGLGLTKDQNYKFEWHFLQPGVNRHSTHCVVRRGIFWHILIVSLFKITAVFLPPCLDISFLSSLLPLSQVQAPTLNGNFAYRKTYRNSLKACRVKVGPRKEPH